MPKKLGIFLLGSSVFLIFIFFSYLVAREVFIPLDFDTTVRLQDNVPRRLDDFFSLLSDVGKFEVSLIILLIFLGLARKFVFGFVAFGLFGLLHIIELYGKGVVDQLPPPEFLIRTKQIIEFPQFHIRSEFSYPSGHAARAAFLTVLLGSFILASKRLSRTQKYILLSILGVYDLLMFVSRPYLGEHWATDVIGGMLLGTSLALMALVFAYRSSLHRKKN